MYIYIYIYIYIYVNISKYSKNTFFTCKHTKKGLKGRIINCFEYIHMITPSVAKWCRSNIYMHTYE